MLNGPGDSRVTAEEIIRNEIPVGAWSHKTVLDTGVALGIGVETLNAMINNAAVMNTLETRKKDRLELQFGTNHLAHFALFWHLKDLLLASSTPLFHSRVVNVSLVAHRYSPMPFENIDWEGNYSGWLAYGASKTADIYMVTQVERLLHPDGFVSPDFQKFSQVEMGTLEGDERAQRSLTNDPQASATSVYGAVSREIEGRDGLYLESAAVVVEACPEDGDAVEYGFRKWTFDREGEERLWKLSKGWTKVE
ncbi:hypothetical protein BJY00DRAFT_298199 [Aspergillus carlsbadensis]|nr:hypothetical protein BJY00DRAFT_298199 [Aspergillus carlsbadensis]